MLLLDTRSQHDFIRELNQSVGVCDVYFHKGLLYVINEYDMPAVDLFIDQEYNYPVTAQLVEQTA